MSWHPSRASRRPLDPAAPSRYRAATVQSRTGRSMLVQLDDGRDRLLPVPSAPLPSLVGSTVLLANDYDWLAVIEPADPVEAVVAPEGGETTCEPVVDGPRGGRVGGDATVLDLTRSARRRRRTLRHHSGSR